MKIRHQRSPSLKTRYRQLICAGIFLASLSAYGQTVYTRFKPESGSWGDANNWSQGLPGDVTGNRAQFAILDEEAEPSTKTFDVTVDDSYDIAALYVFRGATANLHMLDGSAINASGAFVTGDLISGYKGTGGANLNIIGPASGTATIQLNSTGSTNIFGAARTDEGSMTNFSGAGLNIINTGAGATVGRRGNNHELRLSDGAQWTGTKLTVWGVLGTGAGSVSGADGLRNNRAIITGAGTHMTLNNGLEIASGGSVATTEGNVARDNRVEVRDGGKLTVTDVGVRIGVAGNGTTAYRQNNRIEVTGSGSEMIVSNGATLTIGHANNNNNFNNHLAIADGGTYRTDGLVTINSGTNISRNNYVDVGDGGTLTTNNIINNQSGLFRLRSGGSLLAQNIDGSAATATLNINGAGGLEASGHIGEGVTVNVGDGGEARFGFYSTGDTLDLDGTLNLNDGTTATFRASNAGIVDSVVIGSTGMVNIGENVALVIASSVYTFSVGDVFQLFSGELGNLSGSFAESLTTLPSLGEGLEWDLSRFTAEYGYEMTVVPEPSVIALGLGGAALAFVVLRRRRKATR